MGKYCYLQAKRLARLLLPGISAMALLLGCLAFGAQAWIARQQAEDTRQEFAIGIVGLPEGGLLRIGMSALESFDDIGMALELVELEEAEAPQALAQGRVKAYAIIPEGFMAEASHGRLLTIQYVTTPDPAGMAALFQREVTDIIGQVLLESEKASFGTYDALKPLVGHAQANRAINDLSTTLAEFIFARNRAGITVELGVGNAPSFGVYLACGLSVTLVLLMGLCFAPLTVQQNLGVSRMLRARGRGALALALADYGILALGMTLAAAPLYGCAMLALPQLSWSLLGKALPALLAMAALAYLCFSITPQLHHALLLYFFVALGAALVGGCLYPAWFFPESIQRMAAFLPTALARRCLTGCVTGNFSQEALIGCLAYAFSFVALGAALRSARIRGGKEAGA